MHPVGSFKLVAPNKYKAQQKLDIFLSERYRIKFTVVDLVYKATIICNRYQQVDKECSSLLEQVKHEEEENRVEQDRLKGTTLLYGDKLQVQALVLNEVCRWIKRTA